MSMRTKDPTTIPFTPPFSANGNFVLDSLGMVVAEFAPVEEAFVGGRTYKMSDFIVAALNRFAAEQKVRVDPLSPEEELADTIARQCGDMCHED